MMKTKQGLLLTCLLAVALLALPAAVQAQFLYITNNGTITITRYTGSGGAVNFPATINGLPVTTIGDYAFQYCGLTSLTIGNSVTSIGDYAFESSGLTSVTIGNGVTRIGDGAFFACSSLTAITVTAQNTIYSSVDGVLFDKNQATLVEYPTGGSASYTIPDGVTSIGYEAFIGCGLTSVTIPNSVTNIGDNAFWACTSLTNVTIGCHVTSIGDGAFVDAALTSVIIPNSVTSIGDYAFDLCIGLTSVTIPNGVTSIGDYAFSGCINLTAINVDAANPAFSSINGVLFNKNQTALIQYPIGNVATNYAVPVSVTSIGAGAFAGTALNSVALTSVTIGNGVISIGDWAFAASTNLTSVTIPDSVTGIGEAAFAFCSGLTNAIIGNSVTTIGDSAFQDCSSLTSVTIPDSVTSIGYGVFLYCPSLTNVTIGNSVTNIEDNTFAGTAITGVTIPDSVTSIGNYAFNDCDNLISVIIGNGVTTIGEEAFGGCAGLTSVYFSGDAPPNVGISIFERTVEMGTSIDPATVYYLPGTSGWSNTFAGRLTALWFLPNPLILNRGPGFGVQSNQFGFTISWATNAPVVVEACASLSNPVWLPVSTNTLTGGTSYFSDPQTANLPGRFYRLKQLTP